MLKDTVYATASPEELMLSRHLMDQVTTLLPSLKSTGQNSIFIATCPFHSNELPSLVIDYGSNGASCLACGYGENVQTLLNDLKTTPSDSTAHCSEKALIAVYPPGVGTRYGYLLSKEVSMSIHDHLFSSKVKELNSAVNQLAQLVAIMKTWIDSD